jgi:hypothetical protein
MIFAKAKIDIKNLRDPSPRAVPKAAVPRGTSVLGSRYALLVLFWLNRKVWKIDGTRESHATFSFFPLTMMPRWERYLTVCPISNVTGSLTAILGTSTFGSLAAA